MLEKKEQEQVLLLVKSTKKLIEKESREEKVTVKGAADYVTNVDLAVQTYLKKELEKLFPDIAMIAEEKENNDLDPQKTYWILDPIDGTTNLIYGYGMSAVALALYEKGEITFSAVYNPFHEELFHGIKGQGAYLNGQRIWVSSVSELKDAIVSFGSSPYEKYRAEELFPLFQKIFEHSADFRRSGSAELDFCYIACGRQHAYLERCLKPWDYAAGSLILREAGGICEQWSGEELPYLVNADVLAATEFIWKEIRELIAYK